jgi:hypothetical protein
MQRKLKTIETITFPVKVIQSDISQGKCGLISRCMHKVAIERALRVKDPRGGDHKVRIDGGNFRFTLRGYKWRGMTPIKVKQTLVMFDKERKKRAKAEAAGEAFMSAVKPHAYRLEAQRGEKVQAFTRERMDQVNAARNRRRAEGRPDKSKYDLRHRVEGLGAA